MKKKLAILVAIVLSAFVSTSFAMDSWLKTYGDGNYLKDHTVIKTSDSGSLIVGCEVQGSNDGGFALKLDANGAIIWKKRYGDSNWYTLFSAIELADSYLLAGGKSTGSYRRGLILKVSKSDGSITSSREYYGFYCIYALKKISDGDYVAVGYYTNSYYSTNPAFHVVMRLDDGLEPQWRTAISEASNNPAFENVFETSQGDIIFRLFGTGEIAYLDGDDGSVQWIKEYKSGVYTVDVNSFYPNGSGQFAVAGQIFLSPNGLEYVVATIGEDGCVTNPGAKKISTEYNEWPTSIVLRHMTVIS